MPDSAPTDDGPAARERLSSEAGDGGGGEPSGTVAPWLLGEKVAVPDAVKGLIDRPELMRAVVPTNRRLTVLKAPGGFGKTCVLAECCRALRGEGAVAAWLTVDAQDAPQALGSYLVFAFQAAGLDVLDVLDSLGSQSTDDDPPERRTALLLRAVERHGAHCVLALDEMERLENPASVALLNFVVRRGPPNLHLAIACRDLPAGLDIASAILADDAVSLTADDLRFSDGEVARFLGPGRSRAQAAMLARESKGWPIALRILGNKPGGGRGGDVGEVAGNWVESRLLRDLAPADLELTLDAGLFEWMDAGLLDEVLEGRGLKRRLDAIPELKGLVERFRHGSRDAWRLHSLVREHCANWRLRETPARFRSVHRRIAAALARRGETVASMRHAAEAGDDHLAARILEFVGGIRLGLREGIVPLQAIDTLLTPEILRNRPSMGLARVLLLAWTGQLDGARKLYRSLSGELLASSGEHPEDHLELRFADMVTRAALALYGCASMSLERMDWLKGETGRIAALAEADGFALGYCDFCLAIANQLSGEFEAAVRHADLAERRLADSPYLSMFIGVHRGQIAMARGAVPEARAHYAESRTVARLKFLREPQCAVFADIFIRELDLERNLVPSRTRVVPVPTALLNGGTPLPACAAACETAVDLTRQIKGIDYAAVVVEEMRDYARGAGLPALVRMLGAMHACLLADQGRTGEAQRAWRSAGLPERADDCLDLEGQGWREMEAVACARLRLLVAGERFDEARVFVRSLTSLASERGLRRTWMRGLGQWVGLECAAGRPGEAQRILVQYLQLFKETDYARQLVRDRDVCLPVLTALAGDGFDPVLRAAAEQLIDRIAKAEVRREDGPSFSPREMEVLERLESFRDREIAEALGLTAAGVRYHVGHIFRKLEVHSRRAAVERARGMGLLPDPVHRRDGRDRGVGETDRRRAVRRPGSPPGTRS